MKSTAAEKIKGKGLRWTRQRRAIMSAIASSEKKTPFSRRDIFNFEKSNTYDRFSNRIPHIGTVLFKRYTAEI